MPEKKRSMLTSQPILVGTKCQELPNKAVRWTSSTRSILVNFVSELALGSNLTITLAVLDP